jgi:hypothetical protein
MSRLGRAAVAALALLALAGGLALPLVGLAGEQNAAWCCAKGRCCCASPDAGRDERPCLRRGCGCEEGPAAVAGAPLLIEAVLPGPVRLASPDPRAGGGPAASVRPLARPNPPPVPPPKPARPA